MCYAIPGKVFEISENKVIVDYFGEKREVYNEIIDLQIGDYVYAQAGFVIEKLDRGYAEKILEKWKEDFDKLRLIDENLSQNYSIFSKNKNINELMKVAEIRELNYSEALELLKINDLNDYSVLFNRSNKIRHENLKNSSCIHGIIEFSNNCENNCSYCGIRKDNQKLQRYRMTEEEIVNCALYAANDLNFKAIVLQSGEDPYYSPEKIIRIIESIKSKSNVLIFLSIGYRELSEYKRFYDSGARGILMRFETSDPHLYLKIHNGEKSDFQKRINLIKELKKIGFLIITGFLIGLPGQTDDIIIDDILFTKSLVPDMYSIGPMIPHSETPFKDITVVSLEKALSVIAITRLLDNDSKILETTALETLDNNQGKAMISGANSLMINITPIRFKSDYSIYENKLGIDEELKESVDKTIKMLYTIGRAPTDLGI